MTVELGAVADELYGLPPPEFVAARDARASEARRSGDRDLADAIKKLKRPSAAAWAVNLLVRRCPSEASELPQLGRALRQAQARLAGDDLRQLSHERQQLVVTLAAQATREAAEAGYPVGAAVVGEVQASLEAAIADEEAAHVVLSGRLTRGLEHAGTGFDVPGAAPSGSRPPRTPGKSGHRDADGSAGPGALRAAQERASTARRRLDESRRVKERAERELHDAQRSVERLEGDLERRRRELGTAQDRLRQARNEERAAQREEEKAKAALRSAGG